LGEKVTSFRVVSWDYVTHGGTGVEALLTIEEAARALRVKKSTLYTWSYRRQIPSQKVGKALRFRQRDLESWLKSQARPVTQNHDPFSTITDDTKE
jgi:excisionase family DNA binding protein